MATSGSIDFIVNRDSIITKALQMCGAISEGETPSTNQLSNAAVTLNMLVKSWQAAGLNLFAVDKSYLVLIPDQQSYSLSSSTSDLFLSDFIATTTSAATADGNSTLTLLSTTGISASDVVRVIVDGAEVTGTIVSVDSSTQVTTSLTFSSGVDSGARVLIYTSTDVSNRPMGIMEAYFHELTSSIDTPIGVISRRRYYSLSNKAATGRVNQIYYDPQIGSGTLYVWPTATNYYDYLILLTQRTLEDFDASTDDADFPQEWYLPLTLNLAVLIAPEYGVPDQEYYKLLRLAQGYYDMCKDYDQENYTSLYIQQDTLGSEI